MEQPQPAEVTHVHLMVAIGKMEETVDHLRKEIQALNANHEKQIERLTRAEIRIAQGVIIAALLSFTVPLLINATDPRLQFGSHPTERHR